MDCIARDEPVEKHTHVRFRFTDGTELRYKDVRQFGTMHLFKPGEELTLPPLVKLGLEPLDPERLHRGSCERRLAKRTTRIKPLLLNSSVFVGLGNIYVDEALFTAGIHPERTANTLKPREWSRLHEAICSTLGRAVEAGGSSIKSYVNGQGEMGMFQHELLVYGRNDEACRRCGNRIVKSVVGGRGTHTCPACQPLPRGTVKTKTKTKTETKTETETKTKTETKTETETETKTETKTKQLLK